MAVAHILLLFTAVVIASRSWSTATMTHNETTPKLCGSSFGCVKGILKPGYQSDFYEAFLGIPYALPPIGQLRFNAPKAYPKLEQTYDATKEKSDCIQKNYIVPNPMVTGSEDCLYLNVFRPIIKDNKLLPVMVYIHGGGWFSGTVSASVVGPEYFMDTKEVILVTFNYRLGALGFLSTNDINMPGNFGLKDQNLVLRWVQKNIAAFGGNPKMVNIFGQSAGAVSAHLHMLSKQSEGLFRNVIAMSGTANVPFVLTENPLEQARKTAALCNISNAFELSTAKLTHELRKQDAITIVNAGDGLKYWDVDHMTNYRPVVERNDISDAFLTRHPEKIMAKGIYKAVPMLTGFVPNEGAVRVLSILENPTLKESFNKNFNELFGKLMDFPEKMKNEDLKFNVDLLIDEYFNGVHELNNETAEGFLDTVTDRGFLRPLYNAVRYHVNAMNTKKAPIYLYKFNYRGPYSFASLYHGGNEVSRDYGVVHCDDLIYLFKGIFPEFEKDSVDAKVIKDFVRYFVHFAKFGEPMTITPLEPCNRDTFNSKPNAICDYVEFVNDFPDSYQIKTDNKFNLKRIKLWNKILK